MENHIGAEGADGVPAMTHSADITADVSQQIDPWQCIQKYAVYFYHDHNTLQYLLIQYRDP
jgi:hypothetical protein